VQSVAVRLIVEREREIRAFVPEEYWEAFADLTRRGDSEVYRFQVVKDRGENYRPGSAAQSDEAMARLRGKAVTVQSREDRATTTRPNPPFITSTLQQAASTRLSFSVKKTMTMAQRLYEAGYITYMRTDSTNLSADAVGECRDYVQKHFGAAYLPEQPNIYASKAAAQEAHEAIRPSNVNTAPTALVGMEDDAVRLYEMIWRQFVACQMPPAQYTSTTVIAQAGDFELRIRGRILRFDGFTRVLPAVVRKEEDRSLPDFVADEPLDVAQLEALQHFTKPSPRYGEASLVRELEKRGIGRPSTYAAIISTIQERGYVTLTARRFHAEKIGELVTDRLVENFDNLLDFGFTAQLEEELDQIAEGKVDWRAVLNTFYGDFTAKLNRAQAERGGMRPNVPTDTAVVCSVCGRTMQIRTGSTGVFLGCSGYALPPKERCTHTLNLIPGDEVVDVDADSEAESRLLRTKRRCPRCETLMHSYLIDEGRKLHVCSNNPDCPGYLVEQGEFRIKGYDGPVIECDKCGADMQLKSGRFGKYFGCTNTNCKNTRKLLRNGEAAPPKAAPVPMPELRCVKVDDHYVLRDGASGIFLAASQFPKHRETRAPTVAELAPHRAEIDPKHHYLLDAPRVDPDGNPAVVKFSRKTREQFVASEANGAATGWRAVYRNGKWVEENGSALPPKATTQRSPKRASR
jgi:DNA topoisomerase-1